MATQTAAFVDGWHPLQTTKPTRPLSSRLNAVLNCVQVDAAQNGSAPGLSCGFQEIREDVLLDAEQLLEDHQCGIIGLKQHGGHKPERGSNQIGGKAKRSSASASSADLDDNLLMEFDRSVALAEAGVFQAGAGPRGTPSSPSKQGSPGSPPKLRVSSTVSLNAVSTELSFSPSGLNQVGTGKALSQRPPSAGSSRPTSAGSSRPASARAGSRHSTSPLYSTIDEESLYNDALGATPQQGLPGGNNPDVVMNLGFQSGVAGAGASTAAPSTTAADGEETGVAAEVLCQFDNRMRELDNMPDPGVALRLKLPKRRGPCWTLWYQYSRMKDKKTEKKNKNLRVMSKQDLWDMCEDLEVVPRVRRGDIYAAFKASHKEKKMTPSEQVLAEQRPDEIDFPQFVTCMARIALLVYARPEKEKSDRQPNTWKQKVTALQHLIGADHHDTRRLRLFLAQMQRISKQRKQRAVERKWEYVTNEEVPKHVLREIEGEVPEDIIEAVLKFENDDEEDPEWRQYSRIGLHTGTVQILPGYGTKRRYRVVIRNRSDRQGGFKVNITGLPMIEASYSERPLAPGIPRVIELYATFDTEGQWLGAINLNWEDPDHHIKIPMLATCEQIYTSSGIPSHLVPLEDLYE